MQPHHGNLHNRYQVLQCASLQMKVMKGWREINNGTIIYCFLSHHHQAPCVP